MKRFSNKWILIVSLVLMAGLLTMAPGCRSMRSGCQPPPAPKLEQRQLDTGIAYVQSSAVCYKKVKGHEVKVLAIDFKHPMPVLSTLAGYLPAVRTIGNCYVPRPLWQFLGHMSAEEIKHQAYGWIGRPAAGIELLITGEDMDHLALGRKTFRDMTVTVLATAGVRSNAMRTSRDPGNFYEPGTINLLVFTNCTLSPRAMTRALITATEAKTAALLDLDIRSSYSGLWHRATGTGTDNIIVVQGEGPGVTMSGGHTKMGELIGAAVYDAVTEAIYRQNRIQAGRRVIDRLKERGIELPDLVPATCRCAKDPAHAASELARLLKDPTYAGFMETALALSDEVEKGLVSDLTFFGTLCDKVAAEVAGGRIQNAEPCCDTGKSLPRTVQMAFDAFLRGIQARTGAASIEE